MPTYQILIRALRGRAQIVFTPRGDPRRGTLKVTGKDEVVAAFKAAMNGDHRPVSPWAGDLPDKLDPHDWLHILAAVESLPSILNDHDIEFTQEGCPTAEDLGFEPSPEGAIE